MLRKLIERLIGTSGGADLGRSSSVLVLSLKTDVEKVFIDTLHGYELVDLNTLISVEKEKSLYSLTCVYTLDGDDLSFTCLPVFQLVRFLCTITIRALLKRFALRSRDRIGSITLGLTGSSCRALSVR